MISESSVQDRPRLILADDHSMFAEAMRVILSDRFDIIDIVHDGVALAARARRLEPDLIVLDIGMPPSDGIKSAEEIKTAIPGSRFVFLTMLEDERMLAAALRLGPIGYVVKQSAASELTTAIEEVLQGRAYVTARMRRKRLAGREKQPEQVLRNVTVRQKEVLKLLAEGRQMKEIADILHLSEKTVHFHKYQLMRSCGLRTNAELVLFALKSGLIVSP